MASSARKAIVSSISARKKDLVTFLEEVRSPIFDLGYFNVNNNGFVSMQVDEDQNTKPQAGKRKRSPIEVADFATDASMPMGPKGPTGTPLFNNTTPPKTMLDAVARKKPAMIAIAGVSAKHLAVLGGQEFFSQLGQAAKGSLRGVLLSHLEDVTGGRSGLDSADQSSSKGSGSVSDRGLDQLL